MPKSPTELSNLRGQYVELANELGKALNLDLMVAGGAARDLFFGVVPKDVDIFVLNTGPIEEGDTLEDVTSGIAYTLTSLGASDIAVCNSYREKSQRYLDYVVKFVYKGVSFDLICYPENYQDECMIAQVEAFDANINAIYLDPLTGAFSLTEYFADLLRTGTIKNLRGCNGSVPERLQYLQSKYPQYNTKEVTY